MNNNTFNAATLANRVSHVLNNPRVAYTNTDIAVGLFAWNILYTFENLYPLLTSPLPLETSDHSNLAYRLQPNRQTFPPLSFSSSINTESPQLRDLGIMALFTCKNGVCPMGKHSTQWDGLLLKLNTLQSNQAAYMNMTASHGLVPLFNLSLVPPPVYATLPAGHDPEACWIAHLMGHLLDPNLNGSGFQGRCDIRKTGTHHDNDECFVCPQADGALIRPNLLQHAVAFGPGVVQVFNLHF